MSRLKLTDFVKYERAQALEIKDVMALVHRPGLRHIEYDAIVRKRMTYKQLLPKSESGVLILFGDHKHRNSDIGHFCLLFRHPRSGVHFFDPLGLGLGTVGRLTGNSAYLLNLLRSAGHVKHNQTKFQTLAKDVQACGRHCAVRYNLASFSETEYISAMTFLNLKYDTVVTLLTLEQDLVNWEKLIQRSR
jgi:hypothetical protein